jgi:integrase
MPLTRAEADLFLAAASKVCGKSEELILKVMLYSGLRLGEVLAMRMEYVDLIKRAYQVRESFKGDSFSKPKSDKYRWVDLPNFLLEELKEYMLFLKKEKLKKGTRDQISLLFTDPSHQNKFPFSQRKIQMAVKKVCRVAGIAARHPHDLRHTYASWLLMAHQSPAYVQRQLGHSSIDITVDVYGHWISGEGRDGLEDALQPAQSPDDKCILVHM